jgi:hypothetical protein
LKIWISLSNKRRKVNKVDGFDRFEILPNNSYRFYRWTAHQRVDRMLDFNGEKKRHISFDAVKTSRSHGNYRGFREFVPDLKKEFGELKRIICFSWGMFRFPKKKTMHITEFFEVTGISEVSLPKYAHCCFSPVNIVRIHEYTQLTNFYELFEFQIRKFLKIIQL